MLSAHASRGTALWDRKIVPRVLLGLLPAGALLALLGRTLFVTFQLRRAPDGMRGQGWWLGLVLAAGELFAALELILLARLLVSLLPTAHE